MRMSETHNLIFLPGQQGNETPVNGYQLLTDDGAPVPNVYLHRSLRHDGRWAVTDVQRGEILAEKWKTQRGAIARAATVLAQRRN